MRRPILALLAALALGAPPPSLADTASDTLVRAVTEQLRKREGREPTDEELVGALNAFTAEVYKKGQYVEAEQVARIALRRAERMLGSEHGWTLTSINNLAELYRVQGRYGEAEPLLHRALAARERLLGTAHPDTLASLNNLAALYYAQGRYGEAEPLLRRTLAARKRVLGAEHPDTLASLNNLAELCRVQGRYGEAEPLSPFTHWPWRTRRARPYHSRPTCCCAGSAWPARRRC